MECVTKPGLLSLLCCEILDWLQVKVVVQMQVVEVLAMDEEVEHVVTLATHLQPHLHPVQTRRLEELGGFERAEQVPENKGSLHLMIVKNDPKYHSVLKIYAGSY